MCHEVGTADPSTALLITLLIGVPAAATMDRPAANVATEER